MKRDDVYFTALPLYHSSGSVLGVLGVLNVGATVRLPYLRLYDFNTWRSSIHTMMHNMKELISGPNFILCSVCIMNSY